MRVPTEAEVSAAQNLDDLPARVWAYVCLQGFPFALLGFVLLDPPEEVLAGAVVVVFVLVTGGFVGLALRAHRLAYDRRRALNPGASRWDLFV